MSDDYTHRTLLANERTYLAWWRTGLTALTVALAAARVVPALGKSTHHWPYTIVGAGFALLGTACIAYGERRRTAVDRAVRAGDFAEPDRWMTTTLTAGGVVLGVALLVLVVLDV